MKKIIKSLIVVLSIAAFGASLIACGEPKEPEVPTYTYKIGDVEVALETEIDPYIADGVANFIGLFETLGLDEGQREQMVDYQRYMASVPGTDAVIKLVQEQSKGDGNFEFYNVKVKLGDDKNYTFIFKPDASEDLAINIALADDIENRLIPKDAFVLYCYLAEQLIKHPDSIDLEAFASHLNGDTYEF